MEMVKTVPRHNLTKRKYAALFQGVTHPSWTEFSTAYHNLRRLIRSIPERIRARRITETDIQYILSTIDTVLNFYDSLKVLGILKLTEKDLKTINDFRVRFETSDDESSGKSESNNTIQRLQGTAGAVSERQILARRLSVPLTEGSSYTPADPGSTTTISQCIAHLERAEDVREALKRYLKLEEELREVYSQKERTDQRVNIFPLFDEREVKIKIRARNLNTETTAEKDKYLLQLAGSERKPDGTSAVVPSFSDFHHGFLIFTGGLLELLDWSNVVAAGSSVLTPLLPLSPYVDWSDRTLRDFYHKEFAPESDIDLFLYGLSEEAALEKIEQIENAIVNSAVHKVTTIRTRHTITFVSQYPFRHVQIVLRLYRDISEILTGFDVDCCCVAYDGEKVWATPRAVVSLKTQSNAVDLSRRSPSYERRLEKYSKRGFEVYWSQLDRSRINWRLIHNAPLNELRGLARLLAYDVRIPVSTIRTSERIKDYKSPDQDPNEVSDYSSVYIPYGPGFYASKIERILRGRDFLLNRDSPSFHRHPAFIGPFWMVKENCCLQCPEPRNEEDEERAKGFVRGKIEFLKHNPGKQFTGSFNSITEDD